jgi:acetyltransferase-like isoleucine patch superfamily enzyme
MRSLLRFLRLLPKDVAKAVVVYLPGPSGMMLRRWYYRRRLGSCGKDLCISPGVHLSGLEHIHVGNNVHLRENVIIATASGLGDRERREVRYVGGKREDAGGRVEIGSHSRVAFGAVILGYGGVVVGEKCGIGPHAVILSESFHYKGRDATRVWKYSAGADPEEQCVVRGEVVMEDGAGIASNVVVLPGARIGRDAWVGINGVVGVGGRVPPDVIAKGDPATATMRRPYSRSESA